MNKRYLGALIISPLIIFLFVGGSFLRYGLMVLSIFGLFEFFNAIRKKGIKPLSFFAYIATVVYYVFLRSKFVSNDHFFEYLFGILVLSIIVLMCYVVINPKHTIVDVAITILGLLYVSIFFGYIVLVNQKEYGYYLLWLIFLSSWLCDTGAYFTGRFFGKHKLSPKVSPNKTIEGSIGGLILSCLACGIFGMIIRNYDVSIALYNFFLIGLICGVLCQFGDLIASSIKRYIGIKDYSNLIPGHGGILDRFDSILFAAPIVYYYITFILGM